MRERAGTVNPALKRMRVAASGRAALAVAAARALRAPRSCGAARRRRLFSRSGAARVLACAVEYGDVPAVQSAFPSEWQLEALFVHEVLVEDECFHVSERGEDFGGLPELVDRHEGVGKGVGVAHSSQQQLVLPSRGVARGHGQISDPLAPGLVSDSVFDDVVAWAHVDELAQFVVDVPGAPTVDDELAPPPHGQGGAPSLVAGGTVARALGCFDVATSPSGARRRSVERARDGVDGGGRGGRREGDVRRQRGCSGVLEHG